MSQTFLGHARKHGGTCHEHAFRNCGDSFAGKLLVSGVTAFIPVIVILIKIILLGARRLLVVAVTLSMSVSHVQKIKTAKWLDPVESLKAKTSLETTWWLMTLYTSECPTQEKQPATMATLSVAHTSNSCKARNILWRRVFFFWGGGGGGKLGGGGVSMSALLFTVGLSSLHSDSRHIFVVSFIAVCQCRFWSDPLTRHLRVCYAKPFGNIGVHSFLRLFCLGCMSLGWWHILAF